MSMPGRLIPLLITETFVSQVKRWFFCIAIAPTLFPDDPNLPERTREFYNHGTLSKHFISHHLKPLHAEAQTSCPICITVVSLQHTR